MRDFAGKGKRRINRCGCWCGGGGDDKNLGGAIEFGFGGALGRDAAVQQSPCTNILPGF